MTGRAPSLALAALAALLTANSVAAKPQRPAKPKGPPPIKHDEIAGGWHFRYTTEHGPVHVWRPAGYVPKSAGIVIYVHGLYTHADEALKEHQLAEQFAASRQNALFIVPEAPSAGQEDPNWVSLPALLESVFPKTRLPLPRGPLVIVGHSGAYRTIVNWLAFPGISEIMLVDALYGNEDDYAAWLNGGNGRMTLIAAGTKKWTEPFIKRFHRVAVRDNIPDRIEELSKRERLAKLLYLRSQYGHMELVTEGKTIPVLLRRTALRVLPEPKPPVAKKPD